MLFEFALISQEYEWVQLLLIKFFFVDLCISMNLSINYHTSIYITAKESIIIFWSSCLQKDAFIRGSFLANELGGKV